MATVLVCASKTPEWINVVEEHGYRCALFNPLENEASEIEAPHVIVVDQDDTKMYRRMAELRQQLASKFEDVPVIHVTRFGARTDTWILGTDLGIHLATVEDFSLLLRAIDLLVQRYDARRANRTTRVVPSHPRPVATLQSQMAPAH